MSVGSGFPAELPYARDPLRFATKADAAYQMLRLEIVEGRRAPGSLLDQEQLARELGVSTTPLREAIRRLEGEFLLRVNAHKQVSVAPLSKSELNAMYAVRLELEAMAVRLAATHATALERHNIEQYLNHKGDPSDGLGELAWNHEFHRAVYVSSGNSVLVDTLDMLRNRSDRYQYMLVNRGRSLHPRRDAEHERLIRAVVDGDADQASEVMRTHLTNGLEFLHRHLTLDA